MGTYASMAANIAGADPETATNIKVNHARQVVDQVTLLRERVKRQEKAIETVIVERDRAMECCDKQRELIAQLQQKSHEEILTQSSDDDLEVAVIDLGASNEPGARGGHFGRQVPGKTTMRVNSMRGALLRIGGIEISDSRESPNDDEDIFDASEFQPIADEQNVMARLKEAFASGVARLVALFPFKREIAPMESDSLQTSR